MPAEIKLSAGTVMGLQALNRDMQLLALKFSARGGFSKPLNKIVDKVVIPSIEANFQAEGRPNRWRQGDADSRYRMARGGGGPLLHVSGGLQRTATKKARFHIANNIMQYGNWPGGANHKASRYGYTHDLGSDTANIPQRPFAVFQKEDIKDITDVFMDWIEWRVGKSIRLHYGG